MNAGVLKRCSVLNDGSLGIGRWGMHFVGRGRCRIEIEFEEFVRAAPASAVNRVTAAPSDVLEGVRGLLGVCLCALDRSLRGARSGLGGCVVDAREIAR
jgi:hypothetical protein